MTTLARRDKPRPMARKMLNKVPEVTVYFWLIKVLCTTVGETAADFLNDNLGLGLTNTSFAMSAVLVVVLYFQFRKRRYVPGVYWWAVVLISIVGTLITDNLTDNYGIGTTVTTPIFAAALGVVAFSHYVLRLNAVLAFWLAYILTRPLGASMGDGLSQTGNQGLGLGTTVTSLIFLSVIAALVAYLTRTRVDATPATTATADGANVLVVSDRAAATPALLDAIRGRVARGQ